MNYINAETNKDEYLSMYTDYTENQLYHLYEPERGVFIAESPQVIFRALDAGYEPISILTEKRHLSDGSERIIERCGDIPVYVADNGYLADFTGYNLIHGMLCAMKRKRLPDFEAICQKATRIAILEEVVNPTNVGAIIRSAAALGIDAVILTSGCSDPLYRRAARVSVGTSFQVPWTVVDRRMWPETTFDMLRKMGFKTVAMALKNDTVDISDERITGADKLAIILGTEGEGLADSTLKLCDMTAKIPMSGDVDSLNVAAASAVAFWEMRDRKGKYEV